MQSQISRLLALMARLRDPDTGCEWDKAQTHASIVPHTIEEAYEVAEAVESGHPQKLREELGDLLFQTVFQARIAEEAGHFDFEDIARAISDKLVARHPHIFDAARQDKRGMDENRWEAIKADERAEAGAKGALDGVAKALPALIRAQKLQKRAARVGFDWPDTQGPRAKLLEELDELDQARTQEERLEEAGDLLFAAVNLVRAYHLSAEEALKSANAKFERRFRAMEAEAGANFPHLSLEEQEALWQQAKCSKKPESE